MKAPTITIIVVKQFHFQRTSPLPSCPTESGPPGPDDYIFQNLLAAEWAIFNFYQQAVKAFNASSFVPYGFPNTTYDRIQEIRDIEAGHMRVFQDPICNTSIKPGSCEYDFGWTDHGDSLATKPSSKSPALSSLPGSYSRHRQM